MGKPGKEKGQSKSKNIAQVRRDRLVPILNKWIERLALTGWDIYFDIVDDTLGKNISGKESFAECELIPPYKKAVLHFSTHYLDGYNDVALERAVIHELSHIVFAPLYDVYSELYKRNKKMAELLFGVTEEVCDSFMVLIYRWAETGGSGDFVFSVDDEDVHE